MRLKEEDPCWDGYEMVGMKKKNGKEVPNCVPKSEATDSEEQEFHTKLDKLVHNTLTALKDKEHPAHGKAKSLVQRLKDKFSKKESVDEAASFKITNTISKKEWAKTHKDYKSVIDGVPYVMKLTDKGTALVPVKIVESVNEDTKKRFDVDFYKNIGDRPTSHEEIIRGDKFSDVISQATKVAKSKGMNYVEFYYKDAFIGSIDKKSNYTFKKGRNSDKSPLSVNEGASNEEKKIVMMAIKKIAKYRNVPLDVAVVDVIRAASELERTIKK